MKRVYIGILGLYTVASCVLAVGVPLQYAYSSAPMVSRAGAFYLPAGFCVTAVLAALALHEQLRERVDHWGSIPMLLALPVMPLMWAYAVAALSAIIALAALVYYGWRGWQLANNIVQQLEDTDESVADEQSDNPYRSPGHCKTWHEPRPPDVLAAIAWNLQEIGIPARIRGAETKRSGRWFKLVVPLAHHELALILKSNGGAALYAYRAGDEVDFTDYDPLVKEYDINHQSEFDALLLLMTEMARSYHKVTAPINPMV